MRNITGKRIQKMRQMKNLTQDDLAIKLQIQGFRHTRNTVAKIESGIRQVTDVEIKLIADVLGIAINQLFYDED